MPTPTALQFNFKLALTNEELSKHVTEICNIASNEGIEISNDDFLNQNDMESQDVEIYISAPVVDTLYNEYSSLANKLLSYFDTQKATDVRYDLLYIDPNTERYTRNYPNGKQIDFTCVTGGIDDGISSDSLQVLLEEAESMEDLKAKLNQFWSDIHLTENRFK